jgi:NhaP-type Na+/H+ or K+/H+ antiporter
MKRLLYLAFCLGTAVIGHHIHGSGFWAVVNFLFAPLSWLYWLVTQQVSLTIIHDSFSFFLK